MTPDQWFAGAQRVLFVHAHPDDETIATGGTLAALAAAGREPGLVTLTRGERGETRSTVNIEGEGASALATHREGELQNALAALGVTKHAFLGTAPARAQSLEARSYRDSGMEWADDGLAAPATDAGDEALANVAVIELIADLIPVAVQWECDAIVSYDALGGYRHPDHVRAHQLARAVATGLELPFWEIVTDRTVIDGTVTDNTEGVDHAAGAEALIEEHDITAWLPAKRAALHCHASQLAVEGDDIVHVGGQRHAIGVVERFHCLDS